MGNQFAARKHRSPENHHRSPENHHRSPKINPNNRNPRGAPIPEFAPTPRYTIHPSKNSSISGPPPNIPEPTLAKGKIVIALYNFTAVDETDVTFKKGDRMEVLDDSDSDWWFVSHLITKHCGFVPANHVAQEPAIHSEDSLKNTSISGPPPNIPEPPLAKSKIVIALYNFTAVDENDVTFKKGDRMEVLDDSDSDWWFVSHLITKERGSIPANHVAQELTIHSEDWFFEKLLPKEACDLLLSPGNGRGTFLVRPSATNPDGYTLSVNDWDEIKGYCVKHYRILPSHNGGFYISKGLNFPSLSELVDAYSNMDGLCPVLTNPCPKPEPQLWDLGSTYKDNWEIPHEHIKLLNELGRGNFGKVYYGKWKNTIEVAVKTLQYGRMCKQDFLSEAAIMKKCRHRNLVALYAVCSEQDHMYIVQEYMPNGNLLDFLRADVDETLKFEDLLYIAFQVASGMEYLESEELIHRDLAARNVLISKNNKAKICDFGLARVLEDGEYCTKSDCNLPVKWTAPEVFMYQRFTIKSDVWSYGIVLMELFTHGEEPYPAMGNIEVVNQVKLGYRMPNPKMNRIPSNIYEIILRTWDKDPKNRPTFQFLAHDFSIQGGFKDEEFRSSSYI